jgi:hypothetical protein
MHAVDVDNVDMLRDALVARVQTTHSHDDLLLRYEQMCTSVLDRIGLVRREHEQNASISTTSFTHVHSTEPPAFLEALANDCMMPLNAVTGNESIVSSIANKSGALDQSQVLSNLTAKDRYMKNDKSKRQHDDLAATRKRYVHVLWCGVRWGM